MRHDAEDSPLTENKLVGFDILPQRISNESVDGANLISGRKRSFKLCSVWKFDAYGGLCPA